ncbi:hypothetical protein A2662_02415 [Candidatus Giovannonibacteria bacterium RIFCSPHIGHO2_01_FULL_45_33]|nr:MAG: hypothetical protein A2662_02415 [Candidatus Giovannonibacteria bacterium RIFCSPHIGHO2_01_FULL_45_33]OGF71036.1 MAG: hypothetical protein A3C73_00320 [Candidatus Giovannonibacteria bacterium RIFCSPHIGHO2_02_FULL_44_11]
MKNKEFLCSDLGNVIVKFDSSHLKRILKRKSDFDGFLKDYLDFDKGKTEYLLNLFRDTRKYFRKDVVFTDFVLAFKNCLVGINERVFNILLRIKESGHAKFICITDNNEFCIALTALYYPEVFHLFNENGVDRWIVSNEIKSLKISTMPFVMAASRYGASPDKSVFLDDRQENLNSAIKHGYSQDSCFLIEAENKKNQVKLEHFLDKHFPPTA